MTQNLKSVPALDPATMTPEQAAEFIRNAQTIMKQAQQIAAAQRSQNLTQIDSLRYEIFDARESMKECKSCAHYREVAAAAHEELKSLVLTGASKVKFSEDEETTFKARRNNGKLAAAKSAK